MEKLNSTARKYLRSLAHHLKPVVMVGKNGMSEKLTESVDAALADHELIKVKFLEFKENKEEIARTLAEVTGSEIAGIIGNMVIFYREHPQPEKRKIKF